MLYTPTKQSLLNAVNIIEDVFQAQVSDHPNGAGAPPMVAIPEITK